MGLFKVYIKPFDVSGNYQDDFIDISSDVLKITDIKEDLDSTDYDVGVFRINKLKITVRNDHGRFSAPPNDRSILNFKTKDTLVKVTWNYRAEPLCVGFFKAGQCGPTGTEVEVFKGVISELTAASDIEEQNINFDVLSFTSLFDQVNAPFSDITNGDSFSDVFYTLLNQSKITDLLTVDPSNINPGLDQAIDDKSPMEEKTVKELFSKGTSLLLLSQSVLTTENDTITIKTRDPSNDLKYSFYGPASELGKENIIDIKEYKDGVNLVRNYWTWNDTSLVAQDTTSVSKLGIQKKEISSEILTNTTKRQNLLDALRDDFSAEKKELTLVAPLTYDVLDLNLLDRVNIDYPTIYFPADDNPLPRWGSVKWGEFRWPIGSFELTLSPSTEFKIIARKVKTKDETIEFKLKEI